MNHLIYLIEDNYLTIQVPGGLYKFRINDPAAMQTVEFLFKEIRQTEEQFGSKRDKIEPIVKILLASLNIADKYLNIKNNCHSEPINQVHPYTKQAYPNKITWSDGKMNPIVTHEEIDVLLKRAPG